MAATNISCTTRSDEFFCPTKWQLWEQLLALLPRGRAWQTHEAVAEQWVPPESSQVGTFEVGETGLGGEPDLSRLTVMQQYWAAFAEVLECLHTRACALLEEFFCATTTELRREWGVDYGYPNDCEPWETLCEKVAAQGGARCDYFVELAARRGWSIECNECGPSHNRAGCARTGCARTCTCPPNVIWITVRLSESPAYTAPAKPRAKAGRARAGCARLCDPDVTSLICLIERFKPAHVKAHYEVIE